MLGSRSEAEDAVQEAWLRLHRTDTGDVLNLGGWLTTVVARVCLDQLRARKARREDALDARPLAIADGSDVERDALLADAVGPALLVVLDLLEPAERLAFVLHDLFGVSFDEIARIVDRSPAAARQLASRARRRVQGADAPGGGRWVSGGAWSTRSWPPRARATSGRCCRSSIRTWCCARTRPPSRPARSRRCAGHPRSPRPSRAARASRRRPLLDGVPGAVWAAGGQVRAAFVFRFDGERVAGIEIVMDPETIASMETTDDGGR